MLEVAFSESVAGSLKFAIGMKKGQNVGGGAVSVICDDPAEKERILAEMRKPKVWKGGEIPGQPDDVVSLHLQLDYGDLSALETEPEARRAPLEALYGHYEGVADDLIRSAKQAVSRILQADEIRMWIGEQDACDIAAAFWICDMLRFRDVKILAVSLPSMQQSGETILRYGGAGDIEPEELSLHAEKAHTVTPEMKRYMANRWHDIKEENTLLRAMVNGVLMGVPANIYDSVLRKAAPEGEFRLGVMLGRALGKMRGVGDAILYHRVLTWLEDGVLEEISSERVDHPYSSVVRRGPKW